MNQEHLDLALRASHVLTMNASGRCLTPGFVGIRDGRVVSVEPYKHGMEAAWNPKRFLALDRHIVFPGLINAHTHLGMGFFRGIEDDLPLETWLKERVFPLEAALVTEELVYSASLLGMVQMLLSGTTTFVDMYYFEEATARAAERLGVRAFLGPGVLDMATPGVPDAETGLRRLEAFIERYLGHPRITPIVAPHAPYTCSDGTLKALSALRERFGLRATIHVQETSGELQESLQRFGKTPLERLEALGFLDPGVLCVHMVWLGAGDKEVLARARPAVAHCPNSNLKLGSGVCNVAELRDMGLLVGIGTDSVASNDSLDMVREMKTAALLQKALHADPSRMGAKETLGFATSEAAKALGMDSQLGSIEERKMADLVAVEIDTARDFPCHDPYAHLVYTLTGNHVSTVILAGEVAVFEGRLVNDPTEEALDTWQETASRVGRELERLKKG